MLFKLLHGLGFGLASGVVLASAVASCDQAPAEMPYPTPRNTGFSSSCVSGEPIGGLCPELLPTPPVLQSNPLPVPYPPRIERGSGRLYGGNSEV